MFIFKIKFKQKAVDFFNQINMLYGTLTEFCTDQSCPVMSAGPKYVNKIYTTIILYRVFKKKNCFVLSFRNITGPMDKA